MAKTNTTKTIASGPAPKAKKKTVAKKIEETVVEPVVELVEEVKDELNEPVGTVTFNRWEVALAAVAATLLVLIFFL